MSIAQENGAYTVTVNGRAVTTEDRTTGDGETVDFSAAVAAMIETLNNAAYFGITQTYTEAPAADEQMQFTVRSVNGMKLVASSSEPVSDNALVGAEVTGEIEFTGTEWGANQMGTNPAEFYITDDGFVVENTLKAGVSLSDASGVAGGWAGMGTAVAEVNTLDEYSFRINIPKAYYQDETTYCTYDFWFADGSGNWTTASHIIFMRVNFNGADTTKGGTMLIQTLTSQGNGAFVGELDVQGWSFPALKDESGNATSELVVSIRKNSEDGNYYMYVNGYKLELAGRTCNSGELAGQAADLALKTQLGRMENGVFFNCSNGLNGTPSEDYLDTFTIQALNGEKIVNKVPDMTSVDRPAKPSDSDVTINSIKLSWNAPVYVGVDSYNFDFDGYIIEVQKGNDSTVIMTVKSPLDTRNYTFENLEADTRYHFTIYAVQGYDTEEPVRLIKYTSVTVTTDSEEKENQDKDPQPGGCGGIVGISSGLGVAVIAAGVACLVRKRKNTQAK